ncbi:hypothetical protein I3843_05G105600 [Carya illinoinensis]|nr:hypothetical protein I3760_05G117200 [Carya illinoinensis]KAG2706752.1 hypothetical protein I3760_05G117200 [Carya illinoinensis]KAG7978940.1 hypothetical protein I3843_05G105600 [Carya illinoinensis]KAG7978941.1 hypothetical protein I3843_05G105600 [Carya illinoinensis]
MPPSYFPLRWESTGDQWWYASPIDWAAANGLYDLVRELLHLDTNLLIKLTSLRRIRRLETVWDDEAQFDDVAKCRSEVARRLLLECETKRGHNSLIRAGYGGWLLYTAASAGDVDFVKDLLEREPLLVFGEGEYGVTDIFYAAARSKNSEVFRLLLDFALSPRCCLSSGGELEEQLGNLDPEFRWEMMNRAVHAAARGGNMDMLRVLLADCSDVLAFKDAQGSTILHTASGRGQVEVVKDLVASFDIITCTDNQGNTALHVAAYRGYLPVVEVLILASPSLASLTNNYGDTLLHMAVAGFRTPGFRRLDRQIGLMNHLLCGKIVNMEDIINIRNNNGRTALHVAVVENVQCNLVELLMTVPSIGLNIRDADGMTPLDILKQRPQSASSEILMKQLISAGGMSNCQYHKARSALVSHLKMQGIGNSPGTSFRIPDAEIFLYTGIENASDASCDQASMDLSACSDEFSQFDSNNSLDNKNIGSVRNAAKRLKFLLHWPHRKEKRSASRELRDYSSLESFSVSRNLEDCLIPLRQKYSKFSPFPNNKRTFSLRRDLPSPSTKKKFTLGLMHGVIKAMPQLGNPADSPSSQSRSSTSSPSSIYKQKGIEIAGPSCSSVSFNGKAPPMNYRQNSLEKRLMNQYFCVGAQGLDVKDSVHYAQPHKNHKQLSSLVA